MENDTKKLTVTELTDSVMTRLKSMGYSSNYVYSMGSVFNQLAVYCVRIGENRFSTELGMQFLEERYGIKRGITSHRYAFAHRGMDMLSVFQQCGTVMLRRREKREFPVLFRNQVFAYFCAMQKSFKSTNTINTHRTILFRFTEFLDSQDIRRMSEIAPEHLNTYIKMVLCNYSKAIVQNELRVIRRFLEFMFTHGELTEDLSVRLPKLRISNAPSHLPSVFSPEDVKSLLNSVDRNSPSGKRDYAVLMLAAKLGLRTSDIKNLKLENLDWEKRAVSLTQVKTNEPLSLPLPADVGWAIIDYIQHGRPCSNEPEIFLRTVSPHISLQNFDNILVKAMRKAKIPLNRTAHHGLHTLRHSLATAMLEQETPIHVIQEVLGHVNAHTTRRYTAVDINQLKMCALEVPVL